MRSGQARTITTRVVDTHEAKARLSELIRAAEAGVDVMVAGNGQPVARIVAWRPDHPVRRAGAWAGRVGIGDDLVASDPDVLSMPDGLAGALTDSGFVSFDRMLVAQAQLDSLTLMTADDALADYEVELADARL